MAHNRHHKGRGLIPSTPSDKLAVLRNLVACGVLDYRILAKAVGIAGRTARKYRARFLKELGKG